MRYLRKHVFLFLLIFSLNAQDILNKSVQVGETFTITIYTENISEIYEIDTINREIVSNTLMIRTNDKRLFEFLAISPGTSKLSLRKVVYTNIFDDHLIYNLKVEPKKTSRIKVTRIKPEKKPVEDTFEKEQFIVITNLYSSGLLDTSLEKLNDFNRLYPQSQYDYSLVLIQSDILHKKGKLNMSYEVLNQYLNRHKNLNTHKKAFLYMRLAALKDELDESGEAITWLLAAKELPKLNQTNREMIHFRLASHYLKEKKYTPAFSYFKKVYTKHIKKSNLYDLDIYEKTLMSMAEILEISSDLRDIQRAYHLYNELIDTYPDSSYINDAKKKREYLKRNFINPR